MEQKDDKRPYLLFTGDTSRFLRLTDGIREKFADNHNEENLQINKIFCECRV